MMTLAVPSSTVLSGTLWAGEPTCPGLVMDEIRPMLKDCSERTLWCFDRDITEWLRDGAHDQDDYLMEWTAFRNEVRKVIEERKKEDGQT